jgi:hypothetical protein
VGGYSTATDEIVQAVLFGQRVITTNFADPPQSYVMGSSSVFANLIATGVTDLKARYLGVIKDWVLFGNTSDGTYGAQPQRVWWSAIADPTNFPTPGTSDAAAQQSDFQDLFGDAGWVMGIVGNLGTADGAVFQERAVVRVQYVGPPAIFAFQTAEGARGTPAPGSIQQSGNIAYYLGEDGFKAFDGTSSAPIGFNKIDKTFFADLDQSYFYRITSAVDPINQIVYWAYPGVGHSGGNPNRLIAYNWSLQRFTITEADAIQLEIMLRSLTPGYSLETLDALIPSIDAATLSLDSRIYTAGRSVLAAFNTSHALCTFTGANLSPTVDLSEGQLIPGQRAMVTRARPLVDGGTPSVNFGVRETQTASSTYGTAGTPNSSGAVAGRWTGRYHRPRITLPAGSSFTHISGIDIEDVSPMGRR